MSSAHHEIQDPLVGRVIDERYEILERIGEGGMGVVYKARQLSIDRIVAIKMLNSQMAQDPSWVQRFNNEARACSQLQHPNTIRMFEFGTTRDNRPFMAMEFLTGESLRAVISTSAPMPPDRVARILIQCCGSLAEAHAVGIIHRDIKPDNVFIQSMAGSQDFVKLLDFSVAKLLQSDGIRTQAGVVFGTPQYMSPEQGRGLPLDARADLYSLGILAYEMLTGKVPFNHDNPMTVLQMHVRQPLPPLPGTVPPQVQRVVYQALEKDPGKRHQTAGELMQRCRQVFDELDRPVGPGFALPLSSGAGLGNGPGPMGPSPMGPPQIGGAAQLGNPPAMGAPQQMGNQPGSSPVDVPMSDPAAKTVVASQMPAQLQDLIHQQAPADAKTIIAGVNSPPIAGRGSSPQQLPGTPPPQLSGTPPPQLPGTPDDDHGPPKTMMLPNSEGVVSFVQGQSGTSAALPQSGAYHQPPVMRAAASDQISALYWTVCLAGGLAVGVLAYLLVLAIS